MNHDYTADMEREGIFKAPFYCTNKPAQQWFIYRQIKRVANVKIPFVLRHTGVQMYT